MSRELERRIDEIVRLGVICEVMHEQGLCRVSFGERVSPPSPWLAGRAGKDREYWHPDIGEQAVFISPYGDGSEGFVMLGVFSNRISLPEGAGEDRRITEYGDGTRVVVDRGAHIVEIRDSYGSAIKMHDGFIDLLPANKVRVLQGGKQ